MYRRPVSEGEVDRETCNQLIQLLDRYTTTRLQDRHRFLKIGDDVGGTLIAKACIPCLASLAALCHLIGQMEPAATTGDRMDKLCDLALSTLATVTRDTDIEEYTYHDLLLEVHRRFRLLSSTIVLKSGVHIDIVGGVPPNLRRQNQLTVTCRTWDAAAVERHHIQSAFGFEKQSPRMRPSENFAANLLGRRPDGNFKVSESSIARRVGTGQPAVIRV